VPAQNVQNKVVVLKVTELKVGRLRVKNSRYFDVNKIKTDAPSLREGSVPNFGDVTKDIVSLNQWPDRKVTPALRAGVTPDTVDVDLNVDDTLPLHGSVELNNRQSPNTTPLRLTASAQYNDLWQLGHSVSVSYQIAPMRPQDAEVFSGSYLARLPGVDWLSFLVYGVDSNSDVAAIGGLNVVGPGQIVGARAVMTLPSAENFYQTLSLGPDYKRFGETVSQTGGSFSSPVTYYPLVANYTNKYQTDKYSAQLTASVTGNLRPVSSDPTDFDNRRFLASGSFVHLNIDTSHTQELLQGFQLYGRLQGQLADGPLVSSASSSPWVVSIPCAVRPRQQRRQGDAAAEPSDGCAHHRDLRRAVPRAARHGGRRDDHLRRHRRQRRRERQRDRARHRRGAGRHRRRSRRRHPGAVRLQLSDRPHQELERRHPGLRRRIRDEDGRVLFRRSARSDRTSHRGGVTAMQVRSDSNPYDDINITPMLDLAYVLLIIFIIMTTATVQGQKVNLPTASAAPSLATQTTKAITIANDGKIFLDTMPVTLSELRERLIQQKALTPEFPVVVRGDAQAQYQSIMDVLDLLGQVGLTQVGLATNPLVK
jgi:biopolymer transport protein ExbD